MHHSLKIIFIIILISCDRSDNSSTTSAERYKDAVFTAVTKMTVQFDAQPDYNGTSTALFADIYQPIGDNSTARAAIIFVHGGGFTGGTKDGSNIPYFGQTLAKKGFVVASIDYRLGITDQTSAVSIGEAQIRALQDTKSFIRYAKQNASVIKIDTTKIFISGSSAGAGTALAVAFLDFNERPTYLNNATPNSFIGKGNINGHNAKIKAIYSLWGGVIDTLWVHSGDIPVGAIQSISDPCIPWDYAASSCSVPGYPLYGSNSINKRAKHLGILTAIYGYNSKEHDLGFSFPDIDTTITQMTNFIYPLAK